MSHGVRRTSPTRRFPDRPQPYPTPDKFGPRAYGGGHPYEGNGIRRHRQHGALRHLLEVAGLPIRMDQAVSADHRARAGDAIDARHPCLEGLPDHITMRGKWIDAIINGMRLNMTDMGDCLRDRQAGHVGHHCRP
eukprot:Opistho-2@4605